MHDITKSQEKDWKCTSIYNNVLFIFECFHDEQHTQWHKKTLWKYRTRKSPGSQNVFLSFFFFRWASSKLHDSFMMVFTKQQVFTLSSAPTHHSFTLKICRVGLHTELFYPTLFSCFCWSAMYPYKSRYIFNAYNSCVYMWPGECWSLVSNQNAYSISSGGGGSYCDC